MALLKYQAATSCRFDRDVIFLAEAGEEGNPMLGAEYMVNEHFDAIDAEYCLAEGAGVVRKGGKVRYASVETAEKVPNGIDMIARGPSGHGLEAVADECRRSPRARHRGRRDVAAARRF
jgi:metal-dependent amidase/aminoacylase/carboxypeptidase family protein